MKALLDRLLDGGTLDRAEARTLMGRLMDGETSPPLTAALLTVLRVRGETVDEITGLAEGMRERAAKVTLRRSDAVDTCGTGGDGSGTFNISTAAALAAAGAGAAVAKHGNRAVSSRSGSADVLEALGVPVGLEPAEAGRLVDEVGLGFLFAPNHHPAMKHVMPVRRELGVRTVFNILGPLTNPAGVRRQVVGVFRADLCETMARVLGALDGERAYVVHGRDGVDEVSLCAPTLVAELRDGAVTSYEVAPEDFGLARCTAADLAGGDPAANARLIQEILDGAAGPRADAVALNAGFALAAAGVADSPADGLTRARAALADGRARAVLEALRARREA